MTLGSGSASLRKILVVDYCVAVRVFMRRLLEQSGLQVVDGNLLRGWKLRWPKTGNLLW